MRTHTTPGPTVPGVLQQPPALPEEWMEPEPDAPPCELSGMSTDAAAHDETLLVAALEQLAVQRAALEWLAREDLLRLCLV